MSDGAKTTLTIELTNEELATAVREYVERRFSQTGVNHRVTFWREGDEVVVTAQFQEENKF